VVASVYVRAVRRRADKQRIAEWFHTHNTDVFNDEYYENNSTRLAPSYNIPRKAFSRCSDSTAIRANVFWRS
jgi:hypothetical protein